jgi:sialic acid synthase
MLSMQIPDKIQIPLFVAEVGCNHTGDVNVAKQMIVVAKTCGANVVKFQKRCARELLTSAQYNAPYENPHSYGRTYGEHREFLEFNLDTHRQLKGYAEQHGIEYSTSVWDMTSAREIAALAPRFIKVPSACNNHLPMLMFLRDSYGGEVHLSAGMTRQDELDAAVGVFKNFPQRVFLYACTSGYPVPFKDVCMLEILRLRERYENTNCVKAIGFSGHHNGIAIDIAAAVLGVAVIERHFTLDRAWKGSDHAASLEPGGFNRLTRDIRHLSEAWSFKASEILPIEQTQREKLKFRPR